MELKYQILRLIETNSKLTSNEIAIMLNKDEEQIIKNIAELEADKVICAYTTLINWEKTANDDCSAMIELKITPQRGEGFDTIAEKIYLYPEVDSLFLMSGSYDLLVQLKAAPMRTIANFVANKLAVIEEVQSTATHIILKKYKNQGVIFEKSKTDNRQVVTP